MTRDPDQSALLEEARRTLLEELVPELSGGERFKALMIANAMAIARRQIEQDTGARLPEGLARAIRAGERDGDPELYQGLLSEVRARVAISNPKALKDAD